MADLAPVAASVLQSVGSPKIGIAGATITAGLTLYKDATDSKKLKAADANASVDTAACVGVAMNNAAPGQPVCYCGEAGDEITLGVTVVKGTRYVLSATAGKICPISDLASGHWVTDVGIAKDAATIVCDVHPTGIQVP